MAAVSPEFFNSAGKRKTLVAECQGIKWPESRRSGAPKANTVVCGNARALSLSWLSCTSSSQRRVAKKQCFT